MKWWITAERGSRCVTRSDRVMKEPSQSKKDKLAVVVIFFANVFVVNVFVVDVFVKVFVICIQSSSSRRHRNPSNRSISSRDRIMKEPEQSKKDKLVLNSPLVP